MSSKGILLLIKAYAKRIFPLVLMVFGVSVGVGFICGFHEFRQVTLEKELKGAQERYGAYQFCVLDQNISTLKEISLEKDVKESCIVTTEQISWDYGEIYVYHGDETIFQMMPYQLIKGRFPTKENEILCDGNFLQQLGVTQEELLQEPSISVEGKQYKICGQIYKNADETNSYINEYDVIMSPQENVKNGDIYVQTNAVDYKNVKAEWIKKYQIQEGYLYDNEALLSYVGMNDAGDFTGMKSGILFLLKALLYIAVFLFLSFLFVLCRKKYEDIEEVLHILGISRYVSNMIFLLLEGIIFVISYFLLGMVNIYHAGSMLMIAVLIFVFTAFSDMAAFIKNKAILHQEKTRWQRNKISEQKGNRKRENKREQKSQHKSRQEISVLLHSKNIYRSVARQNRMRQRGRNGIFVFLSVLGIVVLSTASYCLNLIYKTVDEKNYDYQLEFKYKDMMELETGKEEYEQLYKKIMEETEAYEAFPLFYDMLYVKIDKENISKEQKDYLRKTSQSFLSEEHNINKDSYTLQIMILSGDLEELKQMFQMDFKTKQLQPKECIAISRIKNISGKMYENGMKKESCITANILLGEDMTAYHIKIKETSKYINMFLSEGYDLPVVILNQEDFKKITRKNYPPMLFVNGEREKVNQELLGLPGVVLTDLNQERQEIQSIKKENQIYIQMFYLVFFLVICVQMVIILYDQYFSFKKPYAYLYTIGLSENQIFRIYGYQNISLVKRVLIWGSVFSFLLTYVIRFIWGSEIYIKYSIPWKEIGIPVVFVCSLTCIVQICFYYIGKFCNFSLSDKLYMIK